MIINFEVRRRERGFLHANATAVAAVLCSKEFLPLNVPQIF